MEYIRYQKFSDLSVDVTIFLREAHDYLVHVVSGIRILSLPLYLDRIILGDLAFYDAHLIHDISCISASFFERYEIGIGIETSASQILYDLSIDIAIRDIDYLTCTILDASMVECDLLDNPLIECPFGSCYTYLIPYIECSR